MNLGIVPTVVLISIAYSTSSNRQSGPVTINGIHITQAQHCISELDTKSLRGYLISTLKLYFITEW